MTDIDEKESTAITTEVLDAGELRKKIRVTVSSEMVNDNYDEVSGELIDNVSVPGFRRGRAPKKLIERKFKKQIQKDVFSRLLREIMQKSLDESGLNRLGAPSLPEDIDKDGIMPERNSDFVMEYETDIAPEFEMPEYKGISIEQSEVEVFDSEIKREFESLAERFAEFKFLDEGKVGNGDILGSDVKVTIGGETVFEKENAMVMETPGKENLFIIREFTPAVSIGGLPNMEVGETRTIITTVADTAENEEWRGSEASVEITLKNIGRRVAPEINDEFLKEKIGKNVEELKAEIRKRAEKELEEKIEKETEEKLVDALLENLEIPLPEKTLEAVANDIFQERVRFFQRILSVGAEGIGEETKNELRKNAKKSAEKTLRGRLLLKKLAEAEEIKVSDEEVDERIVEMARRQHTGVMELYDQLKKTGEIEGVKEELLLNRAIEVLKANANIKIVPRKEPGLEEEKENEDENKKDDAESQTGDETGKEEVKEVEEVEEEGGGEKS